MVPIQLPPGSSPRVRGKHSAPWQYVFDRRLIPACAGKTLALVKLPRLRSAHPRVCGENLPYRSHLAPCRGSSPRVRGKRSSTGGVGALAGLIPACAGKTIRGKKVASSVRAHPRVCGENPGWFETVARDAGSSPRVRGKRRKREVGGVLLRLIPACAGKTARPTCQTVRGPAHPRVCGENVLMNEAAAHMMGSSPRVRGKQRRTRVDCIHKGLIPACAGKTRTNSNP